MRYFILFGIPITIAVTVLIFTFLRWTSAYKPGTNSAAISNKSLETGADAVRALDMLLLDPMLISSSEWTENARAIVREWYGPSPRARKRGLPR